MKILVRGHQVNYSLDGQISGPVVLAIHALATNMSAWNHQIDALAHNFRVLRFDTLGHGGTDAPKGPYTLTQLAEQALGLLEVLGIERAHFLGLSMGGMIGQTLALMAPHCLASLIICSSSSRMPREAQPLWQERIKIAESEGMEPLVEPTIGRWFTASFRTSYPEIVERVRGMIRSTPPAGYSGCCHAVAALDVTDRLSEIKIPTLVIAGELDPGMPVAASRVIHEQIAGSELLVIPEAMHLANVEQAATFNQAVMSFLARIV